MMTEGGPFVANRRGLSVRLHRMAGHDLCTIHVPDQHLPVVVPPQHVTTAITIVVADVVDVPLSPDACHRLIGCDLRTVHRPERNLAAVVAPQDVATPVAVEVAGAEHVPVETD